MPPRRDALTEQQLVRDLWQQVSARIDSSGALRAFLTQKIDDCGQTVAFEAFDLVRQVLNPDGFVRRAHKSADQNLGAAITMPESPWSAAGSIVDRQWDFHGTWHKNRKKWPAMNDYEKLEAKTIQYFCTQSAKVEAKLRSASAVYIADTVNDRQFSMPALGEEQEVLDILEFLPEDPWVSVDHPVRRWETFRANFPADAMQTAVELGKWTGAPSSAKKARKRMTLTVKDLTARKAALKRRGKEFKSKAYLPLNATNKQYWDDLLTQAEKELEQDNDESENSESDSEAGSEESETSTSNSDSSEEPGGAAAASDGAEKTYQLEDMLQQRTPLEPYYRLSWRSQDWAKSTTFPNYNYGRTHKMCNQQERPDLILEVGYFAADSGLFTKRVIVCEIDGEDKTASSTKKDTSDESNDSMPTRKPKDDPVKLALKLMSSTFAQNALQQETYHIRANYVWYFDRLIDKSLLSTTSLELPEVADLIRLYGKDSNSPDYMTLHRAIHFTHHMFTAHVKIAFLIFMQVVHDVDLRTLDKKDPQMCNHCFFVNFEASCLPDELTWQDRMPEDTRAWLESKKMLHTRVQIKTFNSDGAPAEKWQEAPVLDASSKRSAMHQWHANVDSASLPLFPYEKQVCVPVICATIQRVDIKKLNALIRVAADKAMKMYYESKILKPRPTKITYDSSICSVSIKRRQFPDRCFLSRKQQYEKNAWYNYTCDAPLCHRKVEPSDDLLDFTWGYEDPKLKRLMFGANIDDTDADSTTWKQWDQLDVRMHFFDKAMQADKSWKDAVNGMWYLQDYHDFFDMLRKLSNPSSPTEADDLNITLMLEKFQDASYPQPKEREKQRRIHAQQSLALSKYAFRIDDNPAVSGQPEPYHENYTTDEDQFLLPSTSPTEERAYHMFSILAWFFDCRDAGACRWQWEDHVLKYFGAELDPGTSESDFDKFHFRRRKHSETTDTRYFDDTWFLMTVFLELNFRNAVAAMHCRLWEKEAHTLSITGKSHRGLQEMAKELYNRQHSLLNTRAQCAGLQGVSAGLSWQKNAERNCLRNLLLSSLDDTLPGLDPQLASYLQKFNAPNAALFLRMIEVSNVLALRELALQHKLASQAPAAASKRQSSPAASKLEQRLGWFEPAVQSEIRHLMYCVERDDSVFTAAPVVHPTKAIVLEEELMRKWVRQTLGVHQHLHTLRCPLDVKFHLLTSPETYRVFMQLFCTKTQLDNSHTQRPVLFVLLQVYLAALVLKGARQNHAEDDTAVNKVLRTNFAWELLDLGLEEVHYHRQYLLNIGVNDVPCTLGSSLATWPLRDQNLWCKPQRTPNKKVIYAPVTVLKDVKVNDLEFRMNPVSCEMQLEYAAEADQLTRDMADEEVRCWLLLACARPVHCQYELQDDGRFTAGAKKHTFIMQDCAVRQEAEWPHASATGRQRDTMIATVSSFNVSAEHRLEVCLSDDTDTYLFFETVDEPSDPPEAFPQYIQDIITPIPHRTLIYVPQVFASHLRKTERLHDKVYSHGDKHWRMACVGYRAWAWKRLLVKSIFFDALMKVVTRSSVLLSLLQRPVQSDDYNQQSTQNQLYRDMLADTKDTFGALELKAHRISQNLEQKRTQLILTVFLKKHRRVEIDGTIIKFDDPFNSVKVSATERQVAWCKSRSIRLEETTSRFMLIDKRVHEALLPGTTAHVLKDKDVFLYRSYLYTRSGDPELLRHLVVAFKGKLYVKFPSNYNVLKSATGVEVGEIKHTWTDVHFATCWDCRRYSCLKPEYVLAPDSEETVRILAIHARADALSSTISTPTRWRSTPHDDYQACKYICLNKSNDPAYFVKRTTPFIEHSAHSIGEAMQQHMYTLPDTFMVRNLDLNNLPKTSKVSDWNNVTFIDELKKMAALDQKCKHWNTLRNSSRYIALETTTDPKEGQKVEKVLDTGDASFQDPLKEIMATIRRRILPKPNEDT